MFRESHSTPWRRVEWEAFYYADVNSKVKIKVTVTTCHLGIFVSPTFVYLSKKLYKGKLFIPLQDNVIIIPDLLEWDNVFVFLD